VGKNIDVDVRVDDGSGGEVEVAVGSWVAVSVGIKVSVGGVEAIFVWSKEFAVAAMICMLAATRVSKAPVSGSLEPQPAKIKIDTSKNALIVIVPLLYMVPISGGSCTQAPGTGCRWRQLGDEQDGLHRTPIQMMRIMQRRGI
jgi:hypothetical protein